MLGKRLIICIYAIAMAITAASAIVGCKRVDAQGRPVHRGYSDARVEDALQACKAQGRVMANFKARDYSDFSFECVRDDGITVR